MNLTHNDFRTAFGAATFERGLLYFNKRHVMDMAVEQFESETVIQATTAGSGNAVYAQNISLDGTGRSLVIDGECTCPVSYNCKHVAAVCLAYVERARTAPGCADSLASFTVWLQRMAAAGVATPAPDQELVVYLLSAYSSRRASSDVGIGIGIEARIVKPRAGGRGYTRGRNAHLERMGLGEFGARMATSLDRDIAGLLLAGGDYWQGPSLAGRAGYHAVAALLESGRCYWLDTSAPPLTAGPLRELELAWQASGADGTLELTSAIAGGSLLLPTTPPLYLDPERHVIGELDSQGLTAAQLSLLAVAPRVAPQHAVGAAQILTNSYAQLSMPLPAPVTTRENTGQTLQPCLGLYGDGSDDGVWLVLDFCYGSDRIHALPRAASSEQRAAC